jgi:hypothetical protein
MAAYGGAAAAYGGAGCSVGPAGSQAPEEAKAAATQQTITALGLELGEFAAIISSHRWRVLITLRLLQTPYSKH